MGASRKLQGEIDRVLKKVQEGVDVFDSIWNKVYDTENANQKEKFEADLKKEIKKLQRYRDQIKTWIQSSEIKDKKVSASYEQALVDARKLIEREMERFKVCEKETKTKAFSKEGLGQQPKTDPREKAKADTRDWLNNMVSELESQVDCFEADIEGLPKKGKSKPPKLSRLEESIVRHKAHIVKLELVLRLLDNDELSPEQVNEVREFVEDYVERNQVDFDEFGDVDDMYNSLPLDKVDGLEDLVASVPPAVVVKEKAAIAAATGAPAINGSSLKASVPVSASQTVPSTAANQQVIGKEDQTDETESQDSSSDTRPQTPNTGVVQNAGTTTSFISSSGTASGQNAAVNSTLGGSGSLLTRGLGAANSSSLLVGTGSIRVVTETPNPAIALPLANVGREEDGGNFPGRRVSDVATARSLGRAPVVSGIVASQSTSLGSMPLSSSAISGVAAGPDVTKRVALGAEDRVGSTASQQPQGSPLAGQNRVLMQQGSKLQDGTAGNESGIGADGNVMGTRIFNPTLPASQWRPPSANSFQNQLEIGQYRGRTEIAPDQREKFLQRFQQVQQQGHGNALLGSSQLQHMAGSTQKPQPSLLQQAQLQLIQQQHQQQQGSHLQSSQASTLQQQQNGVGIGLQTQALPTASTGSQQQLVQSTAIDSAPQQVIGAISTLKENEVSPVKLDDQQLHHSAHKLPEESNSEATASSGYGRNFLNDDDLKNSYTFDVAVGGPGSLSEFSQLSKDADLSPGQPVTSLPPIGRRSVSDLGAIGDNLVGSGVNAHVHNHQMLEAAFYKLPHPKDHERARNYVPKHPAVTPSYYPQTPAPITDNPALWQRLDPDTLFFAFYHQQNTYQQYLAARELKRQSWRYHRKYNTWFQRYAEPKVTTDEYEQGTYVYFDYHIQDDFQQGWCQRKKAEFVFEYSYLEDELGV